MGAWVKRGLLLFALVASFQQSALCEDKTIAKIFTDKNINGTMVISSLDGKKNFVHNKKRATTRLLPASTFKIPNTLIALDCGVIADDKEIIPWDSVEREYPIWNQDQTLQSAFQGSCVWCYQELARRIGKEAYVTQLKKLQYGNGATLVDFDHESFWLKGDFGITAMEQIEFLRRFVKSELPYKREHVEILRNIMITEKNQSYTLRAKTGLAGSVTPQHGWYVGYVEGVKGVWLFATNIEIRGQNDIPLRKNITIEVLRVKGIL